MGDIIVLEAGNNVPADCRLIEGFGVRVNNATVTGESISRALNIAPSTEPELLHSRLRRQLAYLSRLIACLAIASDLHSSSLAISLLCHSGKISFFQLALLSPWCPEGLLPTLTLSLVLAAQRMAKRNVLIRHLTSVETLGLATIICTDKTGTLTENRMRVRELFLAGEAIAVADKRRDIAERHRDFFMCAAAIVGQDLASLLDARLARIAEQPKLINAAPENPPVRVPPSSA